MPCISYCDIIPWLLEPNCLMVTLKAFLEQVSRVCKYTLVPPAAILLLPLHTVLLPVELCDPLFPLQDLLGFFNVLLSMLKCPMVWMSAPVTSALLYWLIQIFHLNTCASFVKEEWYFCFIYWSSMQMEENPESIISSLTFPLTSLLIYTTTRLTFNDWFLIALLVINL